MIVEYGDELKRRLKNYPKQMVALILDFAEEVENNGFTKLSGRNKSSDDVSTENHNFIAEVKFAQENKLWHYHLGYPEYKKDKEFGDYTSEFYLHYQLFSDKIIIIDIDQHPFKLPIEKYLQK